ncbi:hypothetical protein EDB80DRAFT_840191 [Ilyonectria destructans]|nr:hypothetical protein EDB80DRAFT_840191 [Ilyonectria destructans]
MQQFARSSRTGPWTNQSGAANPRANPPVRGGWHRPSSTRHASCTKPTSTPPFLASQLGHAATPSESSNFNGAPFFPSSPMHCVHYRMPHRGLAGVRAHRTSRNRVCASRNDPVQPAPIKVKSPTSAGNITSQGRVRRGLGSGRHMRLSLAVRRIPNQPVPKFFDGQVANRFSLATPSPYVCDFPEPYHSSPNCSTPTFAREAGGVVTQCV